MAPQKSKGLSKFLISSAALLGSSKVHQLGAFFRRFGAIGQRVLNSSVQQSSISRQPVESDNYGIHSSSSDSVPNLCLHLRILISLPMLDGWHSTHYSLRIVYNTYEHRLIILHKIPRFITKLGFTDKNIINLLDL